MSLSIAAGYALRRFMGVDYDRENPQTRSSFGEYPTVTRSVIYATDSFAVADASVRVRLDADNRLETASGSLSVLLDVNGDQDKLLEITFDLSAYDYGATAVPAFDPDQFGVIPAGSGAPALETVDAELADKLYSLAMEGLKAAGADPDALLYDHTREDDGYYYVVFVEEDTGASVTATLNAEGRLLAVTDEREPYYTADPREPSVMELTDAECQPLIAFLEKVDPDLASRCSTFIPIMEFSSGDVSYLYVTSADENGEDAGAAFILRMSPELKIAAYHFNVE